MGYQAPSPLTKTLPTSIDFVPTPQFLAIPKLPWKASANKKTKHHSMVQKSVNPWICVFIWFIQFIYLCIYLLFSDVCVCLCEFRLHFTMEIAMNRKKSDLGKWIVKRDVCGKTSPHHHCRCCRRCCCRVSGVLLLLLLVLLLPSPHCQLDACVRACPKYICGFLFHSIYL